MTKLLSISISLLILIQSFGIHVDDILVFDDLIEHAEFHSKEYGDDFFVFISKHYGALKAEHSTKHQEEKEEHEQLPFQHQCHTASISVFVLNQFNTYPLEIEMVVDRDSNYFYQVSYHSLAQDGLFQPPRQA
ncbi:hypothetical protein B0O79_2195 [Flavobacteriaceae bacterium MAR_2009_75]|uniref:hypothetical protein n=1 Tax=Pseudozobellia sp. WGM2 TaxID=2787625 RepID=UPI000C2CAC37|nr:hypothetical protein [Pseudozobellia sp. WGM2]PKA98509.1 hypothetical protein B0O79_2195 [Flavobacteriaceae bacterium MAR_2009_75]